VRIRRGDAPLARWLAVASLALLVPAALLLQRAPEPCFLRDQLGIPCPTCGGTRALAALAAGQFGEALARNPLVAVGCLALAAWALWGLAATLVPRWRVTVEASPSLGRRLPWIGLGLVAANWIYLIAVRRAGL
jgi:hypothetical protein